MYKTYFNFCGVIFEVNSPKELWEHSADFKISATKPQVKVNLIEVVSFEKPKGIYLGAAGEKEVWQGNNIITRRTTDVCSNEAHMEEHYNIDDISNIKAYVIKDKWKWATREKYLWTGIALNQVMTYFNTLFFHASYIEVNGEGILFTAPSGTGKSTQADLWCKYRNAKIINGDKAAVRVGDITTVNSIPFAGTSGICENRTVPLKAIVYLSQAPENKIERMSPTKAIEALCLNVFIDKLVSEEWSKVITILLDLVSTVPVYHLACTPDERAVRELENELNK